jgi:hypothetical protein
MMFSSPDWPCLLGSSAEAALFSSLLDESGIPHKVVRHGDVLWGFSEEVSLGWGHSETTPEFQERMEDLYQEFVNSVTPEAEDVESDGQS